MVHREGEGGWEDVTFWHDADPYERECELGSRPDEAKVTRELQAGYAHAGGVPVHGSNGELPAAEDGECHLSPRIPVCCA